ncbi:hypothetical protein [Niveibacterium sp. SC-1]|uniref:hypothetical protein n=1 Tax=Niveibacterium sp. SC-1 TaxID=3135646 RepID=UPI00311F7D5C
MSVQCHPTHASTTRRLALLLLAATLLAFVCAFFLSEGEGDSMRDLLLVSATILLGTLALATFILRAYVCRCANCGRWLVEQEKVDTDEMSRRFVCRRCGIVWDSQVRLSS